MAMRYYWLDAEENATEITNQTLIKDFDCYGTLPTIDELLDYRNKIADEIKKDEAKGVTFRIKHLKRDIMAADFLLSKHNGAVVYEPVKTK